MAGETDQNSCLSSIPELPLYVTNMQKGDYSLFHWPTPGGNDGTVSLNHTYNTDPEIGKLLRTKDFRRALSMGFERDKINENAFLGLGRRRHGYRIPERPTIPGRNSPISKSNSTRPRRPRILDDLGLTDTDGDGIRNRSDGKNISFYLGIGSDQVSMSIAEFVKQDWGDIGIELNFEVGLQLVEKDQVRERGILRSKPRLDALPAQSVERLMDVAGPTGGPGRTSPQ